MGQWHCGGNALQALPHWGIAEIYQEEVPSQGLRPVCAAPLITVGVAGTTSAFAAAGVALVEASKGCRVEHLAPCLDGCELQAVREDNPSGRTDDNLQLCLLGLADVSPHRREGLFPPQLRFWCVECPGHRAPALCGDGHPAPVAELPLRVCPLLLLPCACPAPHLRASRQPGHGRRQGRGEGGSGRRLITSLAARAKADRSRISEGVHFSMSRYCIAACINWRTRCCL
mmetsp:Transcript_3712/g.11162  ORF Transcript_3712/g.11162 Transcript_3712/m.11162 type:complete len:229 (+) Transcript_3712:477-1163(+)